MQKYYVTKKDVETFKKEWPDGNNKVAAIKLVRLATGASLKESKTWVEDGYLAGVDSQEYAEWVVHDALTVPELVGRLFELSAEIAEVHNRLAEMGVEKDD